MRNETLSLCKTWRDALRRVAPVQADGTHNKVKSVTHFTKLLFYYLLFPIFSSVYKHK